ncbi:MAG: papain-like cysteine protease family protein [Bacteroidota bacterium]
MRKKIIYSTLTLIIIIITTVILYRLYFIKPVTLEVILKENNFAKLKPPSRLMSPGTIVLVDKTDKGFLTIICTCENAFGDKVSEKYVTSPSSDINIMNKISGNLDLDLSFLKEISLDFDLKSIKNISIKLSNVKLLELPDDAFFELLNNRTKYCSEAIKNRKNAREQITLIKRVFQADVEYLVDFKDDLSKESKVNLIKDLSVKLNGTISNNKQNSITGKQLYWGVDDDKILGNLERGELPNTGGNNDKNAISKVLSYAVQVEKAYQSVKPLKQPSSMSCWATVYTMMISWKKNKAYSVNEVVNDFGDPWKDYFETNRGLPYDKIETFIEDFGLAYLPPANYISSVYEDLLRENGPLWITSGDGFSSHARLLVGIYDDPINNKKIFEFIDPKNGEKQQQSFSDFIKEYEEEVRFINEKNIDIDSLRIQIIYLKDNRILT